MISIGIYIYVYNINIDRYEFIDFKGLRLRVSVTKSWVITWELNNSLTPRC